MNELVSIIIPIYNYGHFLAEAIDSVINQTYRPIEVIVVDDGSTDNTANIATSYPDVQYIYQPNQGVSVARNTGISKARGKFIAFLDADDIWLPDKLKIQIRNLEENPDIGYNICKMRIFIVPEADQNPWALSSLYMDEQIGYTTLVTTKSVFEKVGDFDARYKAEEDFDWFTRAKDAEVAMAILPDILLNRRLHNNNLSYQNPKDSMARRLQIIKESIERQRRKTKKNEGK